MAISTNGTVIARLAGGLYNTVISNATYLEVAAQDPSTLANTLYARDFAKSTDLAVATTLVTNLGLSTVAGLSNWVAAQLTAAGSAGKGAKIVSMLNDFAGMTADTTYGAAATSFNTKVDAALAASQKTGSVESKFETAGVVAVANATFTLTTSLDTVVGGAGDDTINATAASATTGAAQTSINNGDSINGGAGTDTLNITITAANNNSLTGLTVAAVETVNITGSNNLNATAAAAATAAANKVVTAASLVNAEAALATATNAASAAAAVNSLATNTVVNAAAIEAAVVLTSTATATTAPQIAAAAKHINANAISLLAPTALPTGVKAFTLAQYVDAWGRATTSAEGNLDITGSVARAGQMATATQKVSEAVGAAANASDLVETQLAAAAAKVVTDITAAAAGAKVAAVTTLSTLTPTAFLLLGNPVYTLAQLNAAALAALQDEYLQTTLTLEATVATRANDLKTYADNVATITGDYSLAQLNSAATAALSSATGASLITTTNDEVAIAARAGALKASTAAVVTAATAAQVTAYNADAIAASAVASTVPGSATVSAAQFVDATQVWLKGDASNNTSVTGVAATQTVGFDAVTGMTNSVTYGATVTAGTIVSNAAAGTLTLTGAALASVAISGTGSTGLTLVDGSTTDTIKTLSVATSAATVVNVAGTTALTSATSTGAGGLSLNGVAAKLATVTTGDGADSIRITTATLKDDASTATVETITSTVSTGAGNDSIRVETTGTGVTSVSAGDGNDNIFMSSVGSGVTTVDAGAGNDTISLGTTVTLATYPNMTIAGGEGTDTLVMAGNNVEYTTTDYLQMNSALSGFEAVRFTSEVGLTQTAPTPNKTLDASKLAIGTVGSFTFTKGANFISKVGADQKLVLAKAAAVTQSSTAPMALAVTESAATGLTASAAGYTLGTNNSTLATVYGGGLDVAVSGYDTATGSTALTLTGSSAKITVSATGGATAATSVSPTLVLGATTDVQSLDVTLSSARGTGALVNANSPYLATFTGGTLLNANDPATPATVAYNQYLQGLSSLKISGAGVFTFNAGTVDKLLAKLTTIDLSGMTSFADLTLTGTQATTTNLSTSTVTLNLKVAESVLLGGAKDTITTASTVKAMDTISGFKLNATATSATTVDILNSDKLILTGATAGAYVKFVPTATTFVGALTEAGAATATNLVFAFGGDTYVYSDTGTPGLDDNDVIVKIVGAQDLDLLIATNAIA